MRRGVSLGFVFWFNGASFREGDGDGSSGSESLRLESVDSAKIREVFRGHTVFPWVSQNLGSTSLDLLMNRVEAPYQSKNSGNPATAVRNVNRGRYATEPC